MMHGQHIYWGTRINKGWYGFQINFYLQFWSVVGYSPDSLDTYCVKVFFVRWWLLSGSLRLVSAELMVPRVTGYWPWFSFDFHIFEKWLCFPQELQVFSFLKQGLFSGCCQFPPQFIHVCTSFRTLGVFLMSPDRGVSCRALYGGHVSLACEEDLRRT